jgi:hypothetical protein
MKATSAARQVEETAKKLQWARGYPRDVEIDLRNLERLDPQTFAWLITKEYGTYLMLDVEVAQAVQKIDANRTSKLYIYERGHLRVAKSWDAAFTALRTIPKVSRQREFNCIY